MIHVTHLTSRMRSGFINRMCLAIAISFFSYAASAETYPVSGVWVAKDDRFPGSTAGACLILREFGVDAVNLIERIYPRNPVPIPPALRFAASADRQAPRDEKGDRGSGTPAGRDYPTHLG